MENYILVATYNNEIEARLAQATLAAAEIESFLKFEDAGGMFPVLEQSEGVHLLVDSARADEAQTVLSQAATNKEEG